MADSSTQLDYAPQPSWRSRKGARRAIIAGALLLGLVASIKWIGPGWNHARLLYYQHRCLTHTEPAGNVVYDRFSPSNVGAAYPSGIVSSDWDHFYTLYSPPGGRFNATVFLGELKRNDGSPRLVSIDGRTTHKTYAIFSFVHQFDVHVINPGGIWQQPQLRSNTNWEVPSRGSPISQDISIRKIHAGQRDSDRPDHFTIAIEDAEGPRIIDGWLQADDTVLLELRR